MKNTIKVFEAKIQYNPTFLPVIQFNKVRLQFDEDWEDVLYELYDDTTHGAGTTLSPFYSVQFKRAKLIRSYYGQKNRYWGTQLFLRSYNRIEQACIRSMDAAADTAGIKL